MWFNLIFSEESGDIYKPHRAFFEGGDAVLYVYQKQRDQSFNEVAKTLAWLDTKELRKINQMLDRYALCCNNLHSIVQKFIIKLGRIKMLKKPITRARFIRYDGNEKFLLAQTETAYYYVKYHTS